MTSELRVDKIHNEGGDNDSGIDLSTNDNIVLKTANTTRLTMDATGQTTIVGEGGSTTTSVQQGLAKAWCQNNNGGSFRDSFNCSGTTDNGTGDYTTAINNDMASAYYSIQLNCLNGSTQNTDCYAQAQAAGTVRNIIRFGDSGSNSDAETYLTVNGDLA